MVRGVARVVAVIGESGVGSSSLVRMLGPEVRLRGGSLVSAACHEQRLPEPYALWSEVLRAVRRLPVKSTRVWRELPLARSVARACAGRAHARRQQGAAARGARRLPPARRAAAAAAHPARRHAVGGRASWDALEHLIPQLESERIVLALTIRTGEQSDDALERWARLSLAPAPRRAPHDAPHARRREAVGRGGDGARRGGARPARVPVSPHGGQSAPSRAPAARSRGGRTSRPRGGALALERSPASCPTERDASPRWSGDASRGCPRTAFRCWSSRRRSIASSTRSFCGASASGRRSARRESIRCLVDARILTPTYDRDTRVVSVLARRGGARDARVAARRSDAPRCTPGWRRARRGGRCVAFADRDALRGGGAGRGDASARRAGGRRGAARSTIRRRRRRCWPSRRATRRRPRALASVRVRLAELAEAAGHYEDAEALCDLALNWYEGR